MNEPTTVADWRIAEIRAHMAALPDGHPLKVTRADVALLADVAQVHAAESGEDWHEDVAPIRRLAEKLAALLPPDA